MKMFPQSDRFWTLGSVYFSTLRPVYRSNSMTYIAWHISYVTYGMCDSNQTDVSHVIVRIIGF